MNTEVTKPTCGTISQAKLLSVVRKLIDGEPAQAADPNPAPRGFLDAIIRTAVEDTIDYRKAEKELAPPPRTPPGDPAPFFGSALDTEETRLSFFAQFKPAIYDVIGGPNDRFGRSALNPQPLPPRLRFLRALTRVIVARVEMLHDLAGGKDGEERGIIIVSGYVQRVTDELCPDKFRPRWPFPGPPPWWWFATKLSGLELVVLAAEFEQAGQETYSDDLRRVFDTGRARFAEVGMGRL